MHFFYALVYDPHAKTLVADRGEIRIGSTYQASIPSVIGDKDDDGRGDGEKDENGLLLPELEERLWVPQGENTKTGKGILPQAPQKTRRLLHIRSHTPFSCRRLSRCYRYNAACSVAL